uniref:DNA-directed RNA polymerase n=1 Tax=viral metagenome TaxID=1070528 RepID=A0A6C0LX42_9ZZZZ
MDYDTREITKITFGIYSAKEILGMAVCRIDNPKKVGPNTVYDDRMGTTDSTKICETCHENAHNCQGHFGYIELNEPVVHPLFYKRVIKFLNCFCLKCNRLLLLKDQIYLAGLNRYKGESRFKLIQERTKKVDSCCHPDCGAEHPSCKFSNSDSSIFKVYENKDKVKTSIVLKTEEILKIFDNILDEDVELIGFNPKLVHPRNFIITVLPVIPPCDRPYVKADGNMCDDDITNQYVEIIKANNHLAISDSSGKKEISENKKQKFLASLRFRIHTTFNNSQGKAKHTTNGRAIKGIKERLAGKDGQLRNNMMGKRCNQTGRTVIGPDATLKMGELAVPPGMAEILTVPVRVASFNMELLQKLVDSGDVNSLLKPDGQTRINLKRFRRGTRLLAGDIIYRGADIIDVKNGKELVLVGDQVKRNGEFLERLSPANRSYELKLGWIVERKLQNGDYVLLNRQPTLHKASMMAMKVVLRVGKTLRMNLAITKPFNADFDGDEMNIHVPQSIESQVELEMLSAAQWNLISPQSSKPNMAIVQDSLVGAYRMTQGVKKITKSQFFNIIDKIDMKDPILDRIQHMRRILKEKGKKVQCFTGKGLFSMFLPKDLIYENSNDGDPEEPIVKIYRGVLYEGTLNKAILGATHNSLIQILNKEYSPEIACHFIDCVQFVTNNWLMLEGFTVGLGDCLVTSKEKQQEIQDVIQKCYIEAEGIKKTTSHVNIREMRVNATLNKAKDVGLRIAKGSLTSKNNFLATVQSGSKGAVFNIAQITGLLGQQNLKGQRVPLFLSQGRRSLPHYPFGKLTPSMEYESRGFISSSFIHGLNPREFYFHAMSGREGISDTAMGTATSGYMQRRIVKLTEDLKIQYDKTVRDIPGNIYQMTYGYDGIDPSKTVKVKGRSEMCDVSRLIAKLNMKHEIK